MRATRIGSYFSPISLFTVFYNPRSASLPWFFTCTQKCPKQPDVTLSPSDTDCLEDSGFPSRSLHLFSSDKMPPACWSGPVLWSTNSPHYNRLAFGLMPDHPDPLVLCRQLPQVSWPAQDENANVTRYFERDVPFCMFLGQREGNGECRPLHQPAGAAHGAGSVLAPCKGRMRVNYNSSDVVLPWWVSLGRTTWSCKFGKVNYHPIFIIPAQI